ncbi:hypothetical protein CC1G_12815 [Coprinopsis cinerea okayama7|uniref:Uncharacterized protein n=1 Tax=Coprinopsis cinerea (strain Okayama-7 / 130 / ATCC MYA-4618 / FGSC 9003) TaxID=240176 RepID=A8P922_COPC7|nr:hypothetical protein CC1G_12815 [Coprinopsis cinerea okayama7\|eukprot:XP_001839680.2 hypothetical protein CC1G_12815 [Coprinopsis cinerea okayama7\
MVIPCPPNPLLTLTAELMRFMLQRVLIGEERMVNGNGVLSVCGSQERAATPFLNALLSQRENRSNIAFSAALCTVVCSHLEDGSLTYNSAKSARTCVDDLGVTDHQPIQPKRAFSNDLLTSAHVDSSQHEGLEAGCDVAVEECAGFAES